MAIAQKTFIAHLHYTSCRSCTLYFHMACFAVTLSINFAGKIWMKLQCDYSGSFSDSECKEVVEKKISSWCSNQRRREMWTVECCEQNACLMLHSVTCIIYICVCVCVPYSALYLLFEIHSSSFTFQRYLKPYNHTCSVMKYLRSQQEVDDSFWIAAISETIYF